MAANSRREQILLEVVDTLGTIDDVKSVTRVQPNTLDDIRRYSSQQMPMVAVIGGVPQPVEHKSGRRSGGVDVVLSDLTVDLFIYFMDNKTPDSTLSSLLDDIWTTVYSNQTLGLSFCTGLTIQPKVEVAVWHPYVAFSMSLIITYHHTTGGI